MSDVLTKLPVKLNLMKIFSNFFLNDRKSHFLSNAIILITISCSMQLPAPSKHCHRKMEWSRHFKITFSVGLML
jgi:hypothetical protein